MSMKIETRDFGTVEIQEEDIIRFKQPIFGFDGLEKYVFLFEEDNSHIVWLQSVEKKEICFVMVDPAVVGMNYRKAPPDAVQVLGEAPYMYWVIAVVAEDFKKSTVNLKSPIIVNMDTKCAMQTILEDDLPIRLPLFGNGKERG